MNNRLMQKGTAMQRSGVAALLLIVLLTFSAALMWRGNNSISAQTRGGDDAIYVNHDLSTGDLSQWPHRDYGLGTDIGSNSSGAGYLWYHDNVAGQRAAGMTATPTAHASRASESDSVYLWDPTEPWNYAPTEFWLRTSFLFPSASTISAAGEPGEAAYQPTTGDWNWFLEIHNDSTPEPGCSKEVPNIALEVKTDDHVVTGAVGKTNVRFAARVGGGDDCAPNIVWVNGPALVWDHWYQMLLHVKLEAWGGIFEWYIDNSSTPFYSNLNIPTLYARPSGYISPGYTSLTADNYRFHAPWNSTIYLGPLVVASTRTAAMNAF